MRKTIKLTESDLAKIVTKVIQEQLTSASLASPKAQYTKKMQTFLNSYYKLKLPVDGNWMNPDYNSAMKKYITEKNIQPWICKKGDGYCHDADAGQVTAGENDIKKLKDAVAADMAKIQGKTNTSAKINTNHDKKYDYKLENGKYYYSLKGKNSWVEAKGKGLESIKQKVKF